MTLEPGSNKTCTRIQINDDADIEPLERFNVYFEVVGMPVLTTSTSMVNIQDDGKYIVSSNGGKSNNYMYFNICSFINILFYMFLI